MHPAAADALSEDGVGLLEREQQARRYAAPGGGDGVIAEGRESLDLSVSGSVSIGIGGEATPISPSHVVPSS